MSDETLSLYNIKVDNTELDNYKAMVRFVNELDTARIVKTMHLLDWKWASLPNNENGVEHSLQFPTEAQIREQALSLLEKSVKGACQRQRVLRTKAETFLTATGGLEAEATAYDDNEVKVSVKFVLTAIDNFD